MATSSQIPYFIETWGLYTAYDAFVNGENRRLAKATVSENLYERYLQPWAAKQAYALYYLHAGKPLNEDARVVVSWHSNAGLSEDLFPKEMVSSLENYGTLRQGKKSADFEYAYKWQLNGGYGCFVLVLYEACAVILGIYENPEDAEKYLGRPVFKTSALTGITYITRSA